MVRGMDTAIDATPIHPTNEPTDSSVRRRVSVEERVRARLAGIEVEGDACIDWPGARTPAGYGVVAVTEPDGTRRTAYAHRIVYTMHRGPIPDGLDVRHRCDRPSCVRADHLEIGDRKANMHDAVERDRIAHGEDHHASVLTAQRAIDICRAHDAGATLAALAAEYGVSMTAVYAVIRGQTWSRATGRTYSPRPPRTKEKETPHV